MIRPISAPKLARISPSPQQIEQQGKLTVPRKYFQQYWKIGLQQGDQLLAKFGLPIDQLSPLLGQVRK